jgi:hypothetical protein
MKKTKRRHRTLGPVDRSATTDVVSQLKCCIRNPQAALLGAVIGGMVPWFARTLAHDEIPAAWPTSHALAGLMVAVVLGCAVFSALTVYKFGRAAFGDARKALGFVLALEGVMLVSRGATSTMALVLLIVINALANGSVIALAHDATRRREEADARRSATRARNREASKARREAPVSMRPPVAPMPVNAPMVWGADTVIDAEIVSEDRLLS